MTDLDVLENIIKQALPMTMRNESPCDARVALDTLVAELRASRAANGELRARRDVTRSTPLTPEVDLLHEEDLSAIEARMAHCREVGSTTAPVLLHQLERLVAEARAHRELLASWEDFGANITGCTNHAGHIALEDARAQIDTHIRVKAEMLRGELRELRGKRHQTMTTRWRFDRNADQTESQIRLADDVQPALAMDTDGAPWAFTLVFEADSFELAQSAVEQMLREEDQATTPVEAGEALAALGYIQETRVFAGDLIGNQKLGAVRSALERTAREEVAWAALESLVTSGCTINAVSLQVGLDPDAQVDWSVVMSRSETWHAARSRLEALEKAVAWAKQQP